MSRRTGGDLTYQGTTYEIEASAIPELLAQGVIVPSEDNPGAFELAAHHVFDDVDPHATPVSKRPGFDPRSALVGMLVSHRDGQGR
jgi:hypothetical protein